MKLLPSFNQNGVALTAVAIIIIIMGIMSAYAMNLGYNQRRLSDQASGRRAVLFYRAQAGVVDATTRIRLNYTVGLNPAGAFTNQNYDPAAYQLDIDNNGVDDTRVDIGPANANGIRPISSIGLDV